MNLSYKIKLARAIVWGRDADFSNLVHEQQVQISFDDYKQNHQLIPGEFITRYPTYGIYPNHFGFAKNVSDFNARLKSKMNYISYIEHSSNAFEMQGNYHQMFNIIISKISKNMKILKKKRK